MREQRQDECIQAIMDSGCTCTILATVGFGKTIMAQRLVKRMLDEGVIPAGANILYQTSTENLIGAFKYEAELCKEWYGFNILESANFTFACYNSMLLESNVYDFVINDEVDVVGEVMFTPIEEYRGLMLNMSGTLSQSTPLRDSSKFNEITKNHPLVFEYRMEQGQEEKLLTNFQTVLIRHELDKYKRYKVVFKNDLMERSESVFYKTCDSMVEKYRFDPSKKFMVNRYGRMNTLLVQSCPSKIPRIKSLIKSLSGKRGLVWGHRLDYLEEIIPGYVHTDKNPVLKAFNNQEINVIGFSKKLKRGMTPTLVDYLILTCPVSVIDDLEQIVGRMVRKDTRPDKLPTIYIFVTKDTYEENWLKRGTVEYRNRKVHRTFNLNIIEVR